MFVLLLLDLVGLVWFGYFLVECGLVCLVFVWLL